MKAFADLYEALDSTTSTNAKVAAMAAYLHQAEPSDAAWAVFFLTGRRLKRFISSRDLQRWFLEGSGMPDWLYEACYESVGDTAETIALLNDSLGLNEISPTTANDDGLAVWMTKHLGPLAQLEGYAQQSAIQQWWRQLDLAQTFILNKLLTGALRVGVSQNLVIRALAEVSKLEPSTLSHRLMGTWEPTAAFYETLLHPTESEADVSRPYPFFLAYPLEQLPDSLGSVADWQLEWKWDGIRAQLLKREGQVFLWSRGEELLNGRFPEIEEAAVAMLPEGIVLDGEILAHADHMPLPFAVLQTRIGRKVLSKKLLADAPVLFMAYDLLELAGQDVRPLPLANRRARLEDLLTTLDPPFLLSPTVEPDDWAEADRLREEARSRQVEGFMIKRKASAYQTGRKRGDWWKWKIDPLTVDAVLLYAQAGTGRRANLFTDYTFAVWEGEALVPVAKAYSGLSNTEIEQLDKWIRNNTKEKFGPVRSLLPHHVFELGFEGIAVSSRHKSGVALRFPRILRWRTDKPLAEADTLDTLKRMIIKK